MSGFSRKKASVAFDCYVEAFDVNDHQIMLKYEHSLQVAQLSEEIARSQGLNQYDVDLAWACGLIHDIGRFEQIRNWGTFRDSESCSHAALGVAVLEGTQKFNGITLLTSNGHIENFVDGDCADIVKQAVALHGFLKLPDGLSKRTQTFCEIVRDADKVDIIRVFARSSVEEVLGIPKTEFPNILISDAAMRGFQEERCLGPTDRREKGDILLGVVCLVFELVNASAFSILQRLGYLNELLTCPFSLQPDFSSEDTRLKWNAIQSKFLE